MWVYPLWSVYYGSTKHYFFVKKIFTELEMRYNGNLINNYMPAEIQRRKSGAFMVDYNI